MMNYAEKSQNVLTSCQRIANSEANASDYAADT
jgi:hypothetical protein